MNKIISVNLPCLLILCMTITTNSYALDWEEREESANVIDEENYCYSYWDSWCDSLFPSFPNENEYIPEIDGEDTDGDGIGDAWDIDRDNDGIVNFADDDDGDGIPDSEDSNLR